MGRLEKKELRAVGDEYGVRFRKLVNIQENVYKVISEQGVWCLKRADLGESKARYLSAIQQYLE
ncbi:MAG: hypothetical protein ACYC0N_03880, partial [Carboxydocellales bacterium]